MHWADEASDDLAGELGWQLSDASQLSECSDGALFCFFGKACLCFLVTTMARGDSEQRSLKHDVMATGFMCGAPGCFIAPRIGRKRPEEVGPLLGDQLLLFGRNLKQSLDYCLLGRSSSCGDYPH